jgi:DNA-binding transcriptional LysR family regulator
VSGLETETPAQQAGRPVLRLSSLLSISTDKWEQRWRQQHRHIGLSVRRDRDEPSERAAVITDLLSGDLDLALIRVYGDETSADVSDSPLHAITVYEEAMAVLLSDEHPLADEPSIDGALLDDLELSAALLPGPVARDARQKNLVIVPVTGLEPSRIVCVWQPSRDADDVQDFIGVLRGRTGHSSRAQA